MRGLISKVFSEGRYNVDLTKYAGSSSDPYRGEDSIEDELDRIDDKIADIDEQIAADNVEVDEIADDIEFLESIVNNITAQLNWAWMLAYEQARLNAMPEGPERDDLEAEKAALEEWIEQNDIVEKLAAVNAQIAGMQDTLAEMEETLEGMEEGPEKDAYTYVVDDYDNEIDGLMDDGVDLYEPSERIEEIDEILTEAEGEARDEIEERIEFDQEQLDGFETEWVDLKSDLGSMDLEINLDADLAFIRISIRAELNVLVKERIELWSDIELLELKKTALELKKEALEERLEEEIEVLIRNIWCADLTVDLSGNIGILATESGYNIQPGYEGNAAYDAVRDDVPSDDAYRYGIITAIDYELDTCTVQVSTG